MRKVQASMRKESYDVLVLQLSVRSLLYLAIAASVALMYPASGRLVICCIESAQLQFNFSAAIGRLMWDKMDSKCP